ncbi:MAG: cell division protein ZapA [Hyphomicrobiales bacterium]|nr:cell division protein ZapA [Hyphomicrobiales bacterium]
MAHITVQVNGRSFRMACEDGTERRVSDLAGMVDSVVQDIKGGFAHVQDDRLFLMAALIMADQLQDVREELHKTLIQICNLRSFQAADSASSYIPTRDVARIVDASTSRLQQLEARLDRTGTVG